MKGSHLWDNHNESLQRSGCTLRRQNALFVGYVVCVVLVSHSQIGKSVCGYLSLGKVAVLESQRLPDTALIIDRLHYRQLQPIKVIFCLYVVVLPPHRRWCGVWTLSSLTSSTQTTR